MSVAGVTGRSSQIGRRAPARGLPHVGVGVGRCIVRVDRRRRPAHRQRRVHRDRLLHQRERDDAELVVADDGADTADLARAGEHRRPGLGQHLADAVQVQQHQPPRRAAEVVHPGDRLLPAVAALVQVDGGGRATDSSLRDRAVVAVHPEPRTAGLHAQRLVGVEARPAAPRRGRRSASTSARGTTRSNDGGRAVADRRHAADEAPVERPAPRRPPSGAGRPAATSTSGAFGPHQREHRPLGGDQRGLDPEHEAHLLQEVGQRLHRCPARRRPTWCRRGRRRTRWCSTCPFGDSTSASLPVPSASRSRCWLVRLCSQESRSAPGTTTTSRSLRSTRPAPRRAGAVRAAGRRSGRRPSRPRSATAPGRPTRGETFMWAPIRLVRGTRGTSRRGRRDRRRR